MSKKDKTKTEKQSRSTIKVTAKHKESRSITYAKESILKGKNVNLFKRRYGATVSYFMLKV